jgi:hypothetical protein
VKGNMVKKLRLADLLELQESAPEVAEATNVTVLLAPTEWARLTQGRSRLEAAIGSTLGLVGFMRLALRAADRLGGVQLSDRSQRPAGEIASHRTRLALSAASNNLLAELRTRTGGSNTDVLVACCDQLTELVDGLLTH